MRKVLLALALTAATFAQAAPSDAARCAHEAQLRGAFTHGLMPNMTRPRALDVYSDTDVSHYTLNIAMTPPSNVLAADTTIVATSKNNSLNDFTFRLSNTFTLGQATLDGRPITITRIDSTTCRANFDRAYTFNEEFTLFVPYAGPAVSSFFGSIEFGTRSSGAPYCFTLSEPWYAYTWWANKDDNTDKATFDINVTVPNTMSVVSNGTLLCTDEVAGGKLKFRWRTLKQMAPYLASIAATNFTTWTRPYNYSGGSMPVQYWIWPESDTPSNRTAWQLCEQMLATYAPYYGLYPFIDEKYGMYQFTFGGGMEHQTCTGMGGFWESVVAHELGHQWWGDMITCATWHDIWLNESFATYSEALWAEKRPGGTFAAYKSTMAGNKPSQTSGTVYCYDITDPNRIFSGTYSYNKGSWVLHMLRKIAGDTGFFNMLAIYRTNFEYKSATTDDFINSCEQVYGQDLNWFFDKFVYGGGAPIYRWNWQSITSNGKSYLLVYVKQNQSTTYGTFTMPIDIRPTVGGVKQQKQVFNNGLTENYVIPLTGAATACTFDEDAWILTGGSTSTVTFVAGGPTIVETVPAPGSVVGPGVSQIKVTFHTNVTATASDFLVQQGPLVDANEVASNGGRIPFIYSYSSTTNTATLTLNKKLVAGTYMVTVRDSVRAVNNNAKLDGEVFNNVLPSGDGQLAGNAVLRFSIH